MIFWTTVNIVTACIVGSIVVYMMMAYHERFRFLERLAMVGVAAGMVLRIGPIVGNNIIHADTPYDGWSVALLHISASACAICVLARMEGYDILTKIKDAWRL